jgi:hypothetical protein
MIEEQRLRRDCRLPRKRRSARPVARGQFPDSRDCCIAGAIRRPGGLEKDVAVRSKRQHRWRLLQDSVPRDAERITK